MTADATELEGARIVEFPLRGEWVAVHTPASKIPSHGTDMLGQRYAFDLIRLAPGSRRYYPGPTWRFVLLGAWTRDCFGWGEPVLAPLDGEVVAAVDGVPEKARIHFVRELAGVLRTALTFRPTPEWIARVVGNHVILRHEDGVHSLYAHLATGSVTVQTGDIARTGQQLGRVGHTGNSTAPHLHFQLMDVVDALTAKGVPCAFRAYEVERDGRWTRVEGGIPKDTERIRA